jgi:NAD(P)-dependent dehydrogenase (short-subunit alcohol dehydrogenase family)
MKRTSLITGGAQGIGKATAQRFLSKGYNVLIADHDCAAGDETAMELAAMGTIRFVACDVSREEDVRALVEQTALAFGHIDVLVNNAGVSRRKPLAEQSVEQWREVLDVNLTGPWLCAKYGAPYLMDRNGAIINIASTRAFMSEPHSEAYAASKGGLVSLTHALAVSLGPHVRVNCISPGWIETGDWKKSGVRRTPHHSERDRAQHPVGRVGRPEDIAALVDYLASPQAEFLTGTNIMVDGGMTRKMIYED